MPGEEIIVEEIREVVSSDEEESNRKNDNEKDNESEGDIKEQKLKEFRANVRSKILERIYSKNLKNNDFDRYSGKNDERSSRSKHDDQEEFLIKKKPLSKEWSKTISRLLKNDSSTANRREGIDFFIKSNNRKDDEESEDTASRKKSKDKSKKTLKSPKSEYFNLDETTRRIKRTFKELQIKEKNMKNVFRTQIDDAKMRATKIFDPKPTDILERFSLLDPWNYSHTVRYMIHRNTSSIFHRFLSWCYSFFFPYEGGEEQRLASLTATPTPGSTGTIFGGVTNNNRPTFNIMNLEMQIFRAPTMNEFERSFGRVLRCYELYCETMSVSFQKRFKIVEKIIQELIQDLNDPNIDSIGSQRSKLILEEVFHRRSEMILERRSALVSLLSAFEKANQNRQFSRYVKNETIQLELVEDPDHEAIDKEDKQQFGEEKLFLQQMKTLLPLESSIPETLDLETVLLKDGRHPGEAKFKSISFRHSFKDKDVKPEEKNDEKRYLIKLAFQDQISGSKTEVLQQTNSSQTLKSKRCLSLLLSSNYLVEDTLSAYQTVLTDKRLQNPVFVPVLSVYEVSKNVNNSSLKSDREERFLGDGEIFDVPQWNFSGEKTKKNITVEIKNREQKFDAKLSFESFWNCIPDDFQQDSILLRKEKNFISEINDLDKLDELLNRIRYLSTPSLDLTFQLEQDNNLTNFKIALVEQILRRKMDLEYDKLRQRRNAVRHSTSDDSRTSGQNSPRSRNIADFCTKQELEKNRRFQLFIERSKCLEQGQRSRLKFIPLTNVTEVFFNNILLHDYSNQDRVEKLFEFLQNNSGTLFNKKSKEKRNTREASQERGERRGGRRRQSERELVEENKEEESETKVFQDWLLDSEGNELKNSTRIAKNAVHKLQQSLGLCSNEKKLKYSDIVTEPEIESIEETGIFNAITLLLVGDNRRKLNPSRKDRKRRTISALEVQNKELQLLLNIHSVSSVMEPFQNNELFLEITCSNQTEKTSLSFDQNWNENFRFRIRYDPFKILQITLFAKVPRNSRTVVEPSRYSKSTKKIANDLESEVEIADVQICIGWLEIPLECLLYSSKIEGVFRMKTPYLVNNSQGEPNGGKISKRKKRQNSVENDEEDDEEDEEHGKKEEDDDEDNEEEFTMGDTRTSLSLFMTTDPQIDPSIQGQVSKVHSQKSIEESALVEHCQRYQSTHQTTFPERPIITLVVNTSGEQTVICRYLVPIKTPDIETLFSDSSFSKQLAGTKLKKVAIREKMYETLLLRFVSLLESDFSLAIQIKFDARQFLSTRLGFEFEHSVLLACWLQYLGRNAFILYGNSALEGNVSFVIVYNEFSEHVISEEDLKIIDPRSGQEYSIRDSLIPVRSVFCIVTNDNVYSNIQKNVHPSLISFNLLKTSHWSALFTPKDRSRYGFSQAFGSLITVQPDKLLFDSETSVLSRMRALEEKYEMVIRDRLMSWRRNTSETFTAFNRSISESLRGMLEETEKHYLLRSCSRNIYALNVVNNNPSSQSNNSQTFANFNHQLEEIEEKLVKKVRGQITDVHDLIGYLINFSNTTPIDQIVRRLFATDLHRFAIDPNDVRFSISSSLEFIVAVRFHSYGANLAAGWAYVGVLMPKISTASTSKETIRDRNSISRNVSSKLSLPPMRRSRKAF